MADAVDHLADAASVAGALADQAFEPILVGGMALVLLGSQRVTRDFDFVIGHPRERLQDVVDVFYDRGFELVTRLDDAGYVTATIDNRRVAAIRLRLDAPASAYFFKPATRLRIDLLFDFPVAASTLAKNAVRIKVESHVFHIASEADLLKLKRVARADRSFAGDAQDIEFLEARRKKR